MIDLVPSMRWEKHMIKFKNLIRLFLKICCFGIYLALATWTWVWDDDESFVDFMKDYFLGVRSRWREIIKK